MIKTKPAGLTINEFASNIKTETNCRKICFAGRLDPMARGQVLLLIDEECKKLPDMITKDKTYQFEIIPGFQTDSDDPLGIIENMSDQSNGIIDKISKMLSENIYPSSFNQKLSQRLFALP